MIDAASNVRFAIRMVPRLASTQMRTYATENPDTSKAAETLRKKMEREDLLKKKHEEQLAKMKERQEKRQESLMHKRTDRQKKLEQRLEKWKMEEKVRLLREKHDAKERAIADRIAVREKKNAERAKLIQAERDRKMKAMEKKLKKNEGRPKRPMNAFMWFYKKNYKPLEKELRAGTDRKFPAPEVMKLAMERFKALPQEERDVFNVAAEQDRDRFEKEMAVYKRKREQAKKPPAPYILYVQDVRPTIVSENPEFGITDVAKEAGRRWRELDESTKKKYSDKYAALKEEWDATHAQQ